MQRLAPANLKLEERRTITAEYVCVFGMSKPIPSLLDGDMSAINDIDRSALFFVTKGSTPAWFFVAKMDRVYCGDEIPRFTKKQMEEQVSEHGDFQFNAGITLRDMLYTATELSYLPLEEANHKIWTHNRIVCLGDSAHKMTPNMGQGLNQAIEGAAVLTNCLLDMLRRTKGERVDIEQIEQTLRKYRESREKRVQSFIDVSGLVTRDQAMPTLEHTLKFLFLPLPSSQLVAGKLVIKR